MYIDLTTDCDCGCCGLRFKDANNAEYVIQENPMNDPRLVSNIDFAVEIWVKLSNSGGGVQCIATNYDPNDNKGWWSLIRNGNLIEFIAGVNVLGAPVFANRIAIFSNPITFNSWLHIVANRITNNPVYWEIYVNGQKQNNGGINFNPNFDHYLNLNNKIKFGWWGFDGNNAFLSGTIVQARLYAKPLSYSEVKYNLRFGFYRPFSIEDVFFWAPFNNCVGVVADAFASNALGGGAQILLQNFGNRIVAGGGAWVNDCPKDDKNYQKCIEQDDCKEKPTDEIIIQKCDNLLFPPYTRKNPFINFSNYNTYNLYISCIRQLFFESGWDWYQKNANNWNLTPNNLQTFELYLDLSSFKPQILNLTIHKYECNEITQKLDLAQIFPSPPSTQELLNTIINWIEINVFPNSQVSVSEVAGAKEQFILHVSVPPLLPICDNRIIALSKPGALRPGQEIPDAPPLPGGDGIVIQCCTRIEWQNAPGASNFCTSEAPPPNTPPAALCEDEEDVNVPFLVQENCLGLTFSDNCIEFLNPGTYDIQYSINAAIDQLFGWQKTTCLTGRVRILIQLKILDQVQTLYDYDYVKNNQIITPCEGGKVFWNAGSNSESNTNFLSTIILNSPATQINVTQQNIDDGENKICLRTLVQTRAQLTCFGCDTPPANFCCEGKIGNNYTNNLVSSWGKGIQQNSPWVYVEDTNPSAGGNTVTVNNVCFLGLSLESCLLATGIGIEFDKITFQNPGNYTLNINLQYLRFVCFLWENTKCLKGNATINLYINVFGTQTLLDSFTTNKDQAVECNMPVSGTNVIHICDPVAYNETNPPPGIPINLSIPITYAGGPNNSICFETNAVVTADYVGCNEGCTGGGKPGQICRTINFNQYTNDSIVSCDAAADPPFYPFDDCENQKNGNFKFNPGSPNSAEFFYNNATGCLEILQPGAYTINFNNIIATLEFIHRTYNIKQTHSFHQGAVKIKIANLSPITIHSGSSVITNPQNCNADILKTLTSNVFNNTINLNVTPAMISANQNKICFEYDIEVEINPPSGYCNTNAEGRNFASTEAKIQGSYTICKNQQLANAPGKVAIKAANFLRGTFSVCAESAVPPEDRYVEAIGEVTVNGNFQICKSKQILPNCSYFTYNTNESFSCNIIVPQNQSLPIPPCEDNRLSPPAAVPFQIIQDNLNLAGGNCIKFMQPGSYNVDLNLSYVARKIIVFKNISCFNTQVEVVPYLLSLNQPPQQLTPINIINNVNPALCSGGAPQFIDSETFTLNTNINITQAQINNNENEICIVWGLRVFGQICGIDCNLPEPRRLIVSLQAGIQGDVLICRNPTPPTPSNPNIVSWFGGETFVNNRDKFLEDCFNVRSCFTGVVFWANFCLRLWRDVICIKDNGTIIELPCNFNRVIDPKAQCKNLFVPMRLGYSYLDLLTDKHVSFCSQPIKIVSNCDTVLIRFRNDNEIYKTVRIEGVIEKISFNKNQEVSYSSKGINRKLYSSVSREWEMRTGYYTQRFHQELMRALESDYFEAEVDGKWERFIFEDSYNIEWDEAEPGQKRGKATLKLKSYYRDIYNDFCVFSD